MIRNIIKYLLFLSVGVGLFYLATLDITRGSLVVETSESQFEVGSGLETNNQGLHRIELSSDHGGPYTIADTQGNIVSQGDIASSVTSIFLPEGKYTLQSNAAEGASVVLNGIDRTQALKDDMGKAKVPGIVLSFLLGYLAIVSRGLRWIVLLEPLGYKPSNWRSVHAVAFAYFANTFVPRSGELARCAALNQTDDIPVDKLFGTVISERVVDFIMLFLFMSVAVLGNLDAFTRLLSQAGSGSGEGSNTLLYIGIVIAVVSVFLLIYRKQIMRTALFQKAKGFLIGVGEGLKSVLKMRRKGAFIFHTIFIWSMYFAMAYAIFKSMEGSSHLTTLEALFIMVAGGFGMVLPAPGGIGAYHWTVKLAFIALGLSGAIGFAVANVMWLTQTVMIITTGGFGYLALMFYRIRKDRKLNEHV